MRVAIVLGTRPEIIKMAPVIKGLEKRMSDFFIIHTGQHYSDNINQIFFEQLHLPAPKYNLEVGYGSHAEETGKMLAGILAAVKLHIKAVHIEAGPEKLR